MSFSEEFLRGVVSIFKLTSPPLYRYPYRNSQEAFRSDWKHIGGDMDSTFKNFDGTRDGGDHE